MEGFPFFWIYFFYFFYKNSIVCFQSTFNKPFGAPFVFERGGTLAVTMLFQVIGELLDPTGC